MYYKDRTLDVDNVVVTSVEKIVTVSPWKWMINDSAFITNLSRFCP